jgi:putative ABC transport system ATP-binding protein
MEYIVDCHNLSKSFGEGELNVPVLKKVNLKIVKKEMAMIMGPSGCGKTTLISIIAGILHLDSGHCIVEGHDLKTYKEEQLLKFRAKHLGFVFQNYNLISTFTVGENVAMPLIIQGYKEKIANKEARKILESVGLEGKEDFMPNHLSGGQQQRIAIARALVHKPDLLICDEPTSALDSESGKKMLELLKDINKKSGTTFIIVTHDNRILKYADRIIHLDDGHVIKETKGELHE